MGKLQPVKRNNIMQDFGLISILMAAYNAERTIDTAIDSVLNQSYGEFELIIVNDQSTDDTAKHIQHFLFDKRIKYIENGKNMGAAFSRKTALEAATGEWIAILDSDDAWDSKKLHKQIQLQKEHNCSFLYTGMKYMDNQGVSIDYEFHVPETIRYRDILKQNYIPNSSVLVKKSVYEKYAITDDHIHEDYAMWLSMMKDNIVAYGIDEPLLIYRISPDSKSGNKFKAAKMTWDTYKYAGIGLKTRICCMVSYSIRNMLKYSSIRRAM